jgi:hypothetical protein
VTDCPAVAQVRLHNVHKLKGRRGLSPYTGQQQSQNTWTPIGQEPWAAARELVSH